MGKRSGLLCMRNELIPTGVYARTSAGGIDFELVSLATLAVWASDVGGIDIHLGV